MFALLNYLAFLFALYVPRGLLCATLYKILYLQSLSIYLSQIDIFNDYNLKNNYITSDPRIYFDIHIFHKPIFLR